MCVTFRCQEKINILTGAGVAAIHQTYLVGRHLPADSLGGKSEELLRQWFDRIASVAPLRPSFLSRRMLGFL